MRLSAGRWTAVRGRSRGRETSLAPTFMLRPPLSLAKNQSCLPATHDGRDTIFLTRTSLLPPSLSPPSSLLPLSCHHAALRAAVLRSGAGLPPAPTAPSLPCLHSGGLAGGCKHACGEELTSLSLPLSPSSFPSIPGGAHWRSLPRANKNV